MGQGQGQGQDQDHLLQQRAAPPFLVLALTLVLALVRNIIIFSKVRVLVLNQPIIYMTVRVFARHNANPMPGHSGTNKSA